MYYIEDVYYKITNICTIIYQILNNDIHSIYIEGYSYIICKLQGVALFKLIVYHIINDLKSFIYINYINKVIVF